MSLWHAFGMRTLAAISLGVDPNCLARKSNITEGKLVSPCHAVLFAAVHESAIGPSRHFAATRYFGRFRSEADVKRVGWVEPLGNPSRHRQQMMGFAFAQPILRTTTSS